MAPKIRIAPSCASSPGGTPGGSTGGLPIRRHSSIGPQERRGSTINLSPPTVSSLPNAMSEINTTMAITQSFSTQHRISAKLETKQRFFSPLLKTFVYTPLTIFLTKYTCTYLYLTLFTHTPLFTTLAKSWYVTNLCFR